MINIRYDNCMMKIGIRKKSLPHTHNKKRIPEKVVAAMSQNRVLSGNYKFNTWNVEIHKKIMACVTA